METKCNKKRIYFWILFSLLTLKYIELSMSYYLGGDGVWSLSQTLSMVKGEWGWSRFAHEPDGQMYYNFSYAILYYVPFKIFGVSHYSYLTSYFVYIIIGIIGIFKIFKENDFIAFLVSIMLVGSVYTYDFRFEIHAIIICIWAFYFLFQNHNFIKNCAFILFAWAALIHPATVTALFFVILHYLYLSKQLNNYKLVLQYLAVFLFFALLFVGFNWHHYIDPIVVRPELKQRFMVIRPLNFFKWLTLAGVFVWGFLFFIRKMKWVSVILILLNILVYLLFKKSYYYPYLILHFIIIIYLNKDKIMFNPFLIKIFYIHLALFVGVFFIFPIYKNIENPEYGNMMRSNVNYLKNISQTIKGQPKIYIEREMLMGMADYNNARLYIKEYRFYYNNAPKINLQSNDKIYIFHQSEYNDFKKEMANIIYQKKVVIKQIHKPVKGILTFTGRGKAIGLWEISLAK